MGGRRRGGREREREREKERERKNSYLKTIILRIVLSNIERERHTHKQTDRQRAQT